MNSRSLLDLPFDRTLGRTEDTQPSILYADITSPLFAEFHRTVSQTARSGETSYRLRYRPPLSKILSKPLILNAYGVELSLKRTDYIVIDDRKAADSQLHDKRSEGEKTQESNEKDLRPLSKSELSTLGLNAASYVMSASNPLDTLVDVLQDFPKHSAEIAACNASKEFLKEYTANREAFLPAGYNIIWINGVQIDPRQFNAFSLLEHLRHERTLINSFRSIGVNAQEAVKLLSHPDIAQAQADTEAQRYDFRDTSEGGNVIMWLNDLEKDKRYSGWSSKLSAFLQRVYPGQLPSVRRDLHSVVIPVNLADKQDLQLIVETLQSFVKRMIPVRFGIVPVLESNQATQQAKIAYHTLDVYGLASLFSYFEECLASNKFPTDSSASFTDAIRDRTLRRDQSPLAYDAILESHDFNTRIDNVAMYLRRLSLSGPNPPAFVNAVPIARDESWMEVMSTRVTIDLRMVQRGVAENTFEEDTWLPDLFLFQSSKRRNALIAPEDPKNITVLDVSRLVAQYAEVLDKLPRLRSSDAIPAHKQTSLMLVTDLDSEDGSALLKGAIDFHKSQPDVEIRILHNPIGSLPASGLSAAVYAACDRSKGSMNLEIVEDYFNSNEVPKQVEDSSEFESDNHDMIATLNLVPGSSGILINGRVIGPLTATSWIEDDYSALLTYERARRLAPIASALEALAIDSKVLNAISFAQISSLVARAFVSDVPEGLFEGPPLIRIEKFSVWNGTSSSIHTTSGIDPSIYIVASIDPASELAQSWIPILKVLSALEGIDMQLHLNPRERLTELPIKRFYRSPLSPAPSFGSDGASQRPKATFEGIPADALLNLAMVVPPAWLVAPKSSPYDLDNIKLSSVSAEQNVEAIYELENILIEGHSRDMTAGQPPRGAQLLLGTEQTTHSADTLIMANLGYFQFKANPGYWKISLKPGASEKVFAIDSSGASSWFPQPGDDTNSVALLSFLGKTIFPRLSRNAGMENEDVLSSGPIPGSALDYLSRGASFASSVLGLKSTSGQADINIFSVASGHLYERMLNIMILSVIRHTSHSVKFWFIEQFLSPSFKSFLPHLAAHYKFSYEMVTYKWPHWLRGQKEKQREIWGYKILFLDVLFPLDLDKVIFVDADQIVRTDMMNLNKVDLHGAPYGFTPMCDSRTEMEGFRFWKQGYWANYLQGKPYHISALYVVDLRRFRELAAGDRLRQQYQALSADPASLSNLDQDLPNHMQHQLPIHSLSQEWLWCETWCSDETQKDAKTIDLCNNPQTKEPKLERARRQVPEWNEYDREIGDLAKKVKEERLKTRDQAENVEDVEVGVGGGEIQEEELRKRDEL